MADGYRGISISMPDSDTEDGCTLLHEVHAWLGRFVAYPLPEAHEAHTLWVVHTHFMDIWETTPRIAFLSPEAVSGKTRALEITATLVPNPVQTVNASPAYLFRKVGEQSRRPTVLFDEADTVFGPKAKGNEEIRGLLNAGHHKGAVAGRCIVRGKVIETEDLPAYCAVAIAGLGDLPDTVLTRAIIVRMKRRGPRDRVEQFRRRIHVPEGEALRERLGAWAERIADGIWGRFPDMPLGIEDRDADNWEALLVVADAAGGDWPERARAAAVALVALSKEGPPSLGIRLLADIKTAFGNADQLSTEDLLAALHRLEESPWGDLRGNPLDARGLAQRLRPYGVRPATVRIGTSTPKGYRREDLHDSWLRYLGPPADECATSATTETSKAPEETAGRP